MLLSTRRLDHISRTTCSFGRRSRSRSRPDPGAGRRTIQPTHCLRARIDATAHRGRLLRRSAALSASKLRPRPTRCSRPCCNHTASRQPRPSVGPLQRMCHAAAEVLEAARGSLPMLTTAASWGDPRLYPHLRGALRPARRGASHCDHKQSHEPRRRVCPWPHLPRRGRGARRRARIDAAAHHGRRRGRSRRLSTSMLRGTPNAPRHAVLRQLDAPPAAAERRPMAASSTPQPRRPRPRADRCHRPPRPPPRAIRGSSRIYGACCAECAAARSAATAR